jgi:hypothetical protein
VRDAMGVDAIATVGFRLVQALVGSGDQGDD